MPRKHSVVVIRHEEDDSIVYDWDLDRGLKLVRSCLRRGEVVEVSTTKMSEAEYDSLPEYEGDC